MGNGVDYVAKMEGMQEIRNGIGRMYFLSADEKKELLESENKLAEVFERLYEIEDRIDDYYSTMMYGNVELDIGYENTFEGSVGFAGATIPDGNESNRTIDNLRQIRLVETEEMTKKLKEEADQIYSVIDKENTRMKAIWDKIYAHVKSENLKFCGFFHERCC